MKSAAVTIRITKQMLNKVEAIATALKLTRSNAIRYILVHGIKLVEKECQEINSNK